MDFDAIRHLAIIMDGNGRWAQARGLARTRGHRAGVDSVREIVTACAKADLNWLTLFALSTENYRRRPRHEVRVLMALLRRFMIVERPTFMENRVRLRTVGSVSELPESCVREIRETERLTAQNDGMVLCLALNYGGRSEIADAARALAMDVKSGLVKVENIGEDEIASRLHDPTMPDVDLLVRTAGEFRVSNFLLWQVSYAEMWVTRTCWPDFRPPTLVEALNDFRRRHRRFGGLLAEKGPL